MDRPISWKPHVLVWIEAAATLEPLKARLDAYADIGSLIGVPMYRVQERAYRLKSSLQALETSRRLFIITPTMSRSMANGIGRDE